VNLKDKTIKGLIWSFTNSFAGQGIQFVVGIILARVLSPKEFGLIGMITIFIAVSQSFIDSGFQQALIRKQNPTQDDFSTVFYFNIVIGILFYFLLFVLATPISDFYHEPQLKNLIRVLGLSLLILSFTIIQTSILTKRIDFKLQTKISIIAVVISGTISIFMAYAGWGVWSLVILTLAKYFINSFLLWFWNEWRPILVFSKKSFKELFSFGSKLLVSGLIDTLYNNIYYLIIGKYFSATELGYYTRADQFQAMPSSNLHGIIGRVTYPVFASIQDDKVMLKAAYQKIIRSTMFITFILMMGMAAAAKPMIFTLIGEKWQPAIIYLQLLCFVGMFHPLHALNLNMLNVQGRSDLYLRLEVIKKILAVPIIIVGVIWGIKAMIVGMIVNTMIAYYLNSYWSGRFIGYSFNEQVKDILPSFFVAVCMGCILFIESMFIRISYLQLFVVQIITGIFFIFFMCERLRLKDYLYIKNIVIEKFYE
jgi:teichuronic acid exporter